MGRGPQQRPFASLTVENVTAALRATAGIRSQAARKLSVTRSAITHFVKRHPEMVEIEADIVDENADIAESQVLKGVLRGDPDLVKFYLNNKGGRLGYGRRIEINGAGGGPIQVASNQPYDFSRLTLDEKLQLESLMEKMIPLGLPAPEEPVEYAEFNEVSEQPDDEHDPPADN